MGTIAVIALIAFPAAAFLLEGIVSPALLGGVLYLCVALRIITAQGTSIPTRLALLTGATSIVAVVAWFADERFLKLYPVFVSMLLGAFFAYTLVRPPSAIERIARAANMTVSAEGVGYTRYVTMAWISYLTANAAITLYLVVFASTAAWALYTGVVSYALAGALFTVEYVVRIFYKRRVH